MRLLALLAGLPLLLGLSPAPPAQDVPFLEGTEAAVEFLLATQHPSGGWDVGRYEKGYRCTAITALAAAALTVTPTGEDKDLRRRIEAAVRKAKAYLLESGGKIREGMRENDWNWGCGFGLLGLVWMHRESPDDDGAEAIRALIGGLEFGQARTGTWGYHVPFRKGTKKEAGGSNSATTAVCLLALLEARAAGFAVPDGVLERAVKGMTRFRSDQSAFSYGWARKDYDERLGPSGRNVAGHLVLRLAGESDARKLAWSVGNFLQHWHELNRWRDLGCRKRPYPCHIGTEGAAPYFFSYVHLFASQALQYLPPDARMLVSKRDVTDVRSPAECLKLMRSRLRGLQESDGRWIGSATEGDDYATAMALLVLSGRKLVGAAPPGLPPGPWPKEEKRDWIGDFLSGKELSESDELCVVRRFVRLMEEGKDLPGTPTDLAEKLARGLKARSARIAVVGFLERVRRSGFREIVCGLAADEDSRVALEAVGVLLRREGGHPVAEIRTRLRNPEGGWWTAEMVSFIGATRRDAYVEDVAALLDSRSLSVRLAAVRTLGLLGAGEYVPRIAERLRKGEEYDFGDDNLRLTAEALIRLGAAGEAPAIAGKIPRIGHGPGSILLQNAIEALARLGAKEQAGAIVPVLKQKERGQALGCAAWALGRLGAEEHAADIAALLSVEGLWPAYDDATDSWREVTFRETAARALGELGAKGHAGAIAKLLEDPSSAVRGAAVQVLGRLGAKEHAGAIRKLVEDRGWCACFDEASGLWRGARVGDVAQAVLERWK
ncbi:MAG: HEAT repeat domain-containing protein [Planctomycetota bacterium]|jgi:HEAT repeat protein